MPTPHPTKRPAAASAAFVIGCVGLAALVTATSSPSMSDESNGNASDTNQPVENAASEPPADHALATFGGGCFWCTEAVFEVTRGVHTAVSGYAGGQVVDPTYEAVCSGRTGHAEVIQVAYDPSVISYAELLEVFFKTHDPTTLNRQGADVGTQYRSVIYYHDDDQQRIAEEVRQKLDASGAFRNPIVTEIAPLDVFYPAEAYHQDYFARNPYQGYCQAVIAPKMAKYRSAFADLLKSSE